MAVKGKHYKLLEIIICSHNVDPQYLSLFGKIPIHAENRECTKGIFTENMTFTRIFV
jgi:hypothetical protein